MSNRTKVLFIIVVILILVGIGVFAGYGLIQRYRASRTPEEPDAVTVKTEVVVVTRDLYLGDTISEGDVALVSVPVEIPPRTAITSMDMAIGKFIKTDLVQGEMVLTHNLADPTNNNKDLSFILSDDHVLMAFPASDLLSRETMVQRGDIVDIFVTFEKEIKGVGGGEEDEAEGKTFTVDGMQGVNVTAMIVEVIEEEGTTNPLQGDEEQATPSRTATRIRAYLLALNPQDALVLKHLKDNTITSGYKVKIRHTRLHG